ncbi:hypothetical protein YDYSY3_10970 [Paenibacillus chitinolyticus]|nr:hypothetical protein YDYSY3_10970 [Paenibacillus chitinolyticus]
MLEQTTRWKRQMEYEVHVARTQYYTPTETPTAVQIHSAHKRGIGSNSGFRFAPDVAFNC